MVEVKTPIQEVMDRIQSVIAFDLSTNEKHSIEKIIDEYVIDKEFKTFLTDMGQQMNTQDNASTAHPLFCVFEKKEIVVPYNYDSDYQEWVCVDRYYHSVNVDDEEGIQEIIGEWKEEHPEYDPEDNPKEDDEILEELGYEIYNMKEVDVFVNAHLTRDEAHNYVKKFNYNHNKPFVFVTSLYRCFDMIKLQESISKIKN